MPKDMITTLHQEDKLSLLSVTTGQLDVARIPVIGAPDWIVPQSLILGVEATEEQIWGLSWQGMDIPVYHLLPKFMEPSLMVILESVTDVHRIALQIQGEVTYLSVRIADLKDAPMADYERDANEQQVRLAALAGLSDVADLTGNDVINTTEKFVLQPVYLYDEICVVPNLDKLSHFLVDLDD